MAVFENEEIRLNYWYIGKHANVLVFFTGLGQHAIDYKKFANSLPQNLSLLVIETPIVFYSQSNIGFAKAIAELLKQLNLSNQINLGGFSFGNWMSFALIEANLLNIKSLMIIAPPAPINYFLFQLLNQNKVIQTLVHKIIENKKLRYRLYQSCRLFLYSRQKKAFLSKLLRPNANQQLIVNYLHAASPFNSLSFHFKRIGKLGIPTLLLASEKDPISATHKTIKIAQKQIINAQIKYTKKQIHSALNEEFLKEFGSFLGAV